MLKQPEGKSQSSQREKGQIMVPLREGTDTGNREDMKGESVFPWAPLLPPQGIQFSN